VAEMKRDLFFSPALSISRRARMTRSIDAIDCRGDRVGSCSHIRALN